jgi:hypothetical protein
VSEHTQIELDIIKHAGDKIDVILNDTIDLMQRTVDTSPSYAAAMVTKLLLGRASMLVATYGSKVTEKEFTDASLKLLRLAHQRVAQLQAEEQPWSGPARKS